MSDDIFVDRYRNVIRVNGVVSLCSRADSRYEVLGLRVLDPHAQPEVRIDAKPGQWWTCRSVEVIDLGEREAGEGVCPECNQKGAHTFDCPIVGLGSSNRRIDALEERVNGLEEWSSEMGPPFVIPLEPHPMVKWSSYKTNNEAGCDPCGLTGGHHVFGCPKSRRGKKVGASAYRPGPPEPEG